MAEVLFGVDHPKTHLVRFWMTSHAPKWLLGLYRRHGQAVAARARKSRLLRMALRPFFEAFAELGRTSLIV